MSNNFLMTDWAKDKEQVWKSVVATHGGHPDAFQWGTWDFFDWAVGKAWYTIGSVSKARKFGWTRYDDTYDTWIETFRSFENAGVIPRRDQLASSAHPKIVKLLPHPGDAVAARTIPVTEKALLQNGVKSSAVLDPKMDTNGDLTETEGLNAVE